MESMSNTFCKPFIMKRIKIIPVILTVMAILSFSGDNPLPKLFLIGDSISIQYGPFLQNYLAGYLQFERKVDDGQAEKNLDVPGGANGGDSRMVLAYLKARIKYSTFNPDYLLLNCGLHDIKRNPATNKIQVSGQEYRENLEAIVQLLQEKHIRLIWIRTTSVVDTIHNTKQRAFHRYAADVESYNKIADEVCLKYNIPEIDLFTFSERLGIEQFIDHVHYKEPARDLQAAYIAGNLLAYLECVKRNE
jgi:lysophospholipase L1-like esterase